MVNTSPKHCRKLDGDTVVPGEPSSFNCLSSTDQIERGILLLCHDMSIAFWILLSLTLTSMSWKRLTETLARCRIQTIPVTTSDRLSLDMLASCGSFYPMVSLLLLPLDRSLARETHLEVSSRLLESHACHTSCILKWHATAHRRRGMNPAIARGRNQKMIHHVIKHLSSRYRQQWLKDERVVVSTVYISHL